MSWFVDCVLTQHAFFPSQKVCLKGLMRTYMVIWMAFKACLDSISRDLLKHYIISGRSFLPTSPFSYHTVTPSGLGGDTRICLQWETSLFRSYRRRIWVALKIVHEGLEQLLRHLQLYNNIGKGI